MQKTYVDPMQKTYLVKANSLRKQWYLFDAEKYVLGRMAIEIATILMGKHRPWYTPHVDTGDFVIVVNAEKVKLSGKKRQKKVYYSWSGYPGGLKKRSMEAILHRSPQKIISMAVRRMLPKSAMGLRMLKKMKIYRGLEHPHQAQCPKEWKWEAMKLEDVLIQPRQKAKKTEVEPPQKGEEPKAK